MQKHRDTHAGTSKLPLQLIPCDVAPSSSALFIYIDCCNGGRWKWSRASGSNKVPLAVSITKTSASSSAAGAAAEMVELLLWRQLFCKCLPMYTPLARRRCSFYYSLNRSSSQDSKQRAFLLPVPAHVGLTDAEGRTGGGRRGTN